MSLDEIFFVLMGTCGLFTNALLVIAYFTSIRSVAPDRWQLGRMLLFVGVHELAFSLFLFGQGLLAAAFIMAGCAAQLITLRASSRPETMSPHILTTYFPNNEGPYACGKLAGFLVLAIALMLLASPLREMSVWYKMLFTVPTPATTYFAIALLAVPRTRMKRSRRARGG